MLESTPTITPSEALAHYWVYPGCPMAWYPMMDENVRAKDPPACECPSPQTSKTHSFFYASLRTGREITSTIHPERPIIPEKLGVMQEGEGENDVDGTELGEEEHESQSGLTETDGDDDDERTLVEPDDHPPTASSSPQLSNLQRKKNTWADVAKRLKLVDESVGLPPSQASAAGVIGQPKPDRHGHGTSKGLVQEHFVQKKRLSQRERRAKQKLEANGVGPGKAENERLG